MIKNIKTTLLRDNILFLGPSLLLISLGLILPLVSLVFFSVTNIELGVSLSNLDYVGFSHFLSIFHNPSTWKSFSVTFLFITSVVCSAI